MEKPEIIQHLNDLISVAIDGEQGYTAAAHHVADTHFQTVFSESAKQRASFVKELREEVERLGGAPATSGTLTAAVHRGWLDVKSVISGGDSAGMIAACETGEDSALAAYDRVVNSGISGEPRALIEAQRGKIQQAHQRLLNLKRNQTVE